MDYGNTKITSMPLYPRRRNVAAQVAGELKTVTYATLRGYGGTQIEGKKHFLNLHARKLFFHAHHRLWIDLIGLGQCDCMLSNNPLVGLHKRALKVNLLENVTPTPSDCKYLSILPLKQRLKYNKGVMMQKKHVRERPTCCFGYIRLQSITIVQ